jgi:hypothetical protein
MLLAYSKYMNTVGVLLGCPKAVVEKDMKDVLELEKKIAKVRRILI